VTPFGTAEIVSDWDFEAAMCDTIFGKTRTLFDAGADPLTGEVPLIFLRMHAAS